MSAAALLCALLYTSLEETVTSVTLEETVPLADAAGVAEALDASIRGAMAEAGEAVAGEEEERELWLELLADRRWRGLSCAEVGTRFGSCAKIASVPLLAAAVLPGGATAAGKFRARHLVRTVFGKSS